MKPRIEVDKYGNKRYLNNRGYLHREDGPAYEGADGCKGLSINGKLHREDGPAFEYASGTKTWWINGSLHRENGPAYEGADGTKEWFINHKQLTEAEFKHRTNPCKCPDYLKSQ